LRSSCLNFQNAEITGVYHHAWQGSFILKKKKKEGSKKGKKKGQKKKEIMNKRRIRKGKKRKKNLTLSLNY
jgi:hypothetical protein